MRMHNATATATAHIPTSRTALLSLSKPLPAGKGAKRRGGLLVGHQLVANRANTAEPLAPRQMQLPSRGGPRAYLMDASARDSAVGGVSKSREQRDQRRAKQRKSSARTVPCSMTQRIDDCNRPGGLLGSAVRLRQL
jgi:hypothetical protein